VANYRTDHQTGGNHLRKSTNHGTYRIRFPGLRKSEISSLLLQGLDEISRNFPGKTGQVRKETIAVWKNWVYNNSVQKSHFFLLEGGN